MNRARLTAALTLTMLVAAAHSAGADVRADEKTHVQFAGMLGRMYNLFGGKAAREGVTTTVAVKGDRMVTTNDATGQIIDLGEEKIYDLDLKKKTYKVTTFAQLRQQMEDARMKAAEEERKEQAQQPAEKAAPPPPPPPPPDASQPQVDIDFDIKNTGQTKTINGFDTHEAVMTITVREKGKTLEESGGLVLTSDMWLGPPMPATKEIIEFDLRYAQKLYGPMVIGVSPDQMAGAMAMYPDMKPAMARMAAEGSKLEGTPVQTVTTLDAVKSADEMAQEAKAKQEDDSSKPKLGGGVGGMIGAFGKKMAAKKMNGGDDGSKPRAMFMTMTNEVLKVVTDVAPADVAVPAGFRENK